MSDTTRQYCIGAFGGTDHGTFARVSWSPDLATARRTAYCLHHLLDAHLRFTDPKYLDANINPVEILGPGNRAFRLKHVLPRPGGTHRARCDASENWEERSYDPEGFVVRDGLARIYGDIFYVECCYCLRRPKDTEDERRYLRIEMALVFWLEHFDTPWIVCARDSSVMKPSSSEDEETCSDIEM